MGIGMTPDTLGQHPCKTVEHSLACGLCNTDRTVIY